MFGRWVSPPASHFYSTPVSLRKSQPLAQEPLLAMAEREERTKEVRSKTFSVKFF